MSASIFSLGRFRRSASGSTTIPSSEDGAGSAGRASGTGKATVGGVVLPRHTHTHPLVDEHLELWKAPKNGVESGKGANGWASTLHAAKGKGRWSVTETLTTAKKNQRKAFSMILWSKNKMRQVTDATSNFMKINRSLRQRQTIQALAGLAPIGGL